MLNFLCSYDSSVFYIIFGLYENLTLKRFYTVSLLALLPATSAYNSIGMSLSTFVLKDGYKIKDLFTNVNFLLPLFLVVFIIIFSSYIKKKHI